METSNITTADVAAFIASADKQTCLNLHNAINTRVRAIDAERAATAALTLRPGQKVRLGNLSPKELNGLDGEITSIDGMRVTVEPDIQSTGILSFGRSRFASQAAIHRTAGTRITVPGVPIGSCDPI